MYVGTKSVYFIGEKMEYYNVLAFPKCISSIVEEIGFNEEAEITINRYCWNITMLFPPHSHPHTFVYKFQASHIYEIIIM